MNYLSHIGAVSFGKRDGFELFAQAGGVGDFYAPPLSHLLTKALVLRQEELRLVPDSELLSIARFSYENHNYQAICLYRYTLDIYKRDGYYASGLICKDAQIPPAESLTLLYEWLAIAEAQHRGERVSLSLNQALVSLQRIVGPPFKGTQQVFLPVATGNQAFNQVLDAVQKGDLSSYRRVFASSESRLLRNLDAEQIKVLDHHRLAVSLKPAAAHNGSKNESLVYAFEDAGVDRWAKKQTTNGKAKAAKSTKKEGNSLLLNLKRLLNL